MPNIGITSCVASIFLFSGAIAIPAVIPTCGQVTGSHYNVKSQIQKPGTPMTGDYSVSGATGSGQLTQQSTYTVGVTVEVGLDLGLSFEDIVDVGLSAAVSVTTETGTTEGVTDTCPQGGWYCALAITPNVLEVSGTVQDVIACTGLGAEKPWTVNLPLKGEDGNPIINAEACTCQNLIGWADPGHVPLLCPGNCALPPPML